MTAAKNIIFSILVFVFSQLGELSTIQGLVAAVTGTGMLKDPVLAFDILAGGLVVIGLLGIFLPNEFAKVKAIAESIRAKIEVIPDVNALMNQLKDAQAQLEALKPIVAAAQTASGTATPANLDALATGQPATAAPVGASQ